MPRLPNARKSSTRKPRTRPRQRAEFYTITGYLQHYTCFHCRKVFKQPPRDTPPPCPQCARPMTNMGTDFRAPPQKNVKQWQKVEALARAGVRFFPTYPSGLAGERPRTLAEVPQFLRGLCPPTEAQRLLEGPPAHRARPRREGKLQARGHAPHQTFWLLGQQLGRGDCVEVWHAGQWRERQVWGRDGGGPPSRLIGPQRRSDLPLEAGLRMRFADA